MSRAALSGRQRSSARMTRAALCFPGQGSQAAGMANGLSDGPLATHAAGGRRRRGPRPRRRAARAPTTSCVPPQVAQPALLFVELVLADALPAGLDVVGVAGHSVGEYAAVSVAGAISPEDAMRLVIRRGREMAAMTEGTMAAVIGLDADDCDRRLRRGERRRGGGGGRQPQRAGAGGGQRLGRRRRAGRGAGTRARSAPGGAAQRQRRVPFAADGAGGASGSPPPSTPRRSTSCASRSSATSTAPRSPTPPALPSRLARQLESPVRWVDCVTTLVGDGRRRARRGGAGGRAQRPGPAHRARGARGRRQRPRRGRRR